jgi:hypothetical protein
MGNNKTELPEPEEFTDKEKIVYDILCSDETPPNGQHWEGFVAQKIVEALAQPEPEPQEVIAKWIKTNTEHREWYICPKCSHQTPRFKDEWQGLTDEDVKDIVFVERSWADAVRKVEAKLKEKNSG